MRELIDRQALRAAHGLGSDCHDCKRDMKSCQYDRDYSLMDFCEWLDDAPTASQWHRVEEPPIEYQRCMVYSSETRQMVSGVWTAEYGWMIPGPIGKLTHWMPIEPPKEDA